MTSSQSFDLKAKGRPVAIAVATLALTGVLGGCSPLITGAADNVPETTSDTTSQDRSTATNELVSRAYVAAVQEDSLLLVDADNETPYFAPIPEGGISDSDGASVALDALNPGDTLEVTGNGIMLESYPGQYPGVSKLVRIAEGTEADKDRFESLVAEVLVTPSQDEPPVGNASYQTSLANVSVMLTPFSASYVNEAGDEVVSEDISAFNEAGVLAPSVPDVRIDGTTDITLGFDFPVLSAQSSSIPVYAADGDTMVDLAQGSEAQSCSVVDGEVTLSMTPQALYRLDVEFGHGSAIYWIVALPQK